MADPRSKAVLGVGGTEGISRQTQRLVFFLSRLWAWVFLGLMIVFFVVAVPIASNGAVNFLTVRNSQNILVAITPVLLLGLGQTFVIIGAGIDLSVGWVMSLASVLSALAIRAAFNAGLPLFAAVVIGFLAAVGGAGVVGLINGVIIAKLKVPAFIVTLGTSFIVRGVALLMSENTTVIGLPPGIRDYGNDALLYYLRGEGGGFYFLQRPEVTGELLRRMDRILPWPVVITAIVVAIAIFLLRRTQFGRHTYAIGGNMEAAIRTGIPVDRHIIMLYMLSASTAGIAGFLSTLRFTAGSAVIGDPLLLSSIAAVIIGGVSLFGGAGTVIGTVIGALIIAVLTTGLVMLNVEAFWQFIVVGAVVIIAVLIDQSRDLIIGRADASRRRHERADPFRIRNLTKRFGGLIAVNDVSWDVYPGEVVALLGDNGAGKSTLIKCISGVYQADEGEIFFRGRADPLHPADRCAREGHRDDLPGPRARQQSRRPGQHLPRPRDEAPLSRRPDPHARRKPHAEEVEAALDSLEIHFPNLTQPIESLSGGQRQAVAIARAVYWDARLMIMDEPTNNLGVPEQHKVLELIRRLRDQGVPVILITHTLPDVFAVADRLMVMHRGRKVDREEDRRHQHAGAGAVHGRRARRHTMSPCSARRSGKLWRVGRILLGEM